MLGSFCWLYNQALEERISGYRDYGWSFSYREQSNGLKYMRQRDERLRSYSARAELFVLKRLDVAFAAFFRRVKQGQKPGFPRFKPAARFDSARFEVGDGLSYKNGRIGVLGIAGLMKAKVHRPLPAKPKNITVKREGPRWFIVCQVEVEATEAEREASEIGIDVGLSNLVALSTGEVIAAPQWVKRAARSIKKRSRALARAQKASTRRTKARQRLSEAHRKVSRQRSDFLHKLSRSLVASHTHIAVEDLRVANMTRSNLGKSIHNAAWTTLRNMLTYKAEEAGSVVLAVRPHGTSQMCSCCGCTVPKSLAVRVHECPHCGLTLDRDVNAARNILARADFRLGTSRRDISAPVAA